MTPKVVVVDDDSSSASLLTKMLHRMDCQVLVCTSPESAAELALSREIDLVCLDISMPNLDGYQVLSLIRSHEYSTRSPSVPVIAVTGRTTPADRARALAEGFAAHLSKPVMFNRLRYALLLCFSLRSDLHRTRYTSDKDVLEHRVRGILGVTQKVELQATTAGLSLALSQQGRSALKRSLQLAFEGHAEAAARPLEEFIQLVDTLNARLLQRSLRHLIDQLDQEGDQLETAAVLARAELDRVIFTVGEQLRL